MTKEEILASIAYPRMDFINKTTGLPVSNGWILDADKLAQFLEDLIDGEIK